MDIKSDWNRFYGPDEIQDLTEKIISGEEKSIILLLSISQMQQLHGSIFMCFGSASRHAIEEMLRRLQARGIHLPLTCLYAPFNFPESCQTAIEKKYLLLVEKAEEERNFDYMRKCHPKFHSLFLFSDDEGKLHIQAVQQCGNHYHSVNYGLGDHYYRVFLIIEALRELFTQF
ncbi:MAG: hypothetical protein WCV59_01440 [Parcubacteria group bacterium]|jgi:hypothetical protein